MTLGDIIKKFRIENEYSMDTFAQMSGLSKGYISMLEKNLNPLKLVFFKALKTA